MFLPFQRRIELAGSATVMRTLALAGVALLLIASSGVAHAEEQAAPTVRIRGDAASHELQTSSISTNSTSEEAAVYEVGGRELKSLQPEPAEPATPPAGAGEFIAGFALGYVGYPYVAAGNTPAGFDCSGFTQWVILNTLGIDIGHGLTGQPGAGYWIDWGAWLPGDLVFFQNTYQAGLSHVGIYLGDGLFVHAENGGTGVVISSMYSDYYGPRYWGAVRVA